MCRDSTTAGLCYKGPALPRQRVVSPTRHSRPSHSWLPSSFITSLVCGASTVVERCYKGTDLPRNRVVTPGLHIRSCLHRLSPPSLVLRCYYSCLSHLTM